ncbi:MAG: hypothetical protein IJ867_02800 [Clostridia bacterium]|nr:hypothetical protein [Clostridia bacterium]
MLELNRIQVDKFKLEEALSFEELEEKKDMIENYLIKMEDVFKDFPRIDLPSKKKELFLNGVKLKGFEAYQEATYNIYIENFYIGLGVVQNGTLKRDIII